ncbi:MAG: DEAD/DEAH box helicase family protein, partial [Planctomycetes bacterium]|nr:DEAD/DEAH box helicase family protein [Planctomycetota bacterium]
MITKASKDLTLKDRLSRLSYLQACKLLGPDGARLIREGGACEIDVDEQVYLRGDLFRLSLRDATVTITLMAEARDRLCWNCTSCSGACEHVGAAFSLILEEKMALRLSAPPPERIPVESLREEELVARAIEERRQRAREETMRIQSMNPRELWTDYTVTSAASGKTYRVALRGWEPGESYCSCPDFRKNTLGTCKHILHALAKLKRRFPASACKRPYRRKHVGVHVRYGKERELRLLLPSKLDPDLSKAIGPLRDRAAGDIRDLLRRIRRIEGLGKDVIIYPDAEELMEQRLLQERLGSLAESIRKNPAKHPLRKTLLKTELLPYQLDGIAFAMRAGRAILADDMGLGKTIQGIGVAEILAREAGVRKVLIVCPASVKAQWRDEIRRFSGRSCQIVLGSATERERQYENERFFTICNYEQVMRDITSIEQIAWDLIVLDEAQRIKNWEAKTSRIIKGLRSRFALALSGTPLENRLDELFSVVEFVDEQRLGPAFRFFNRHRMVDEKGKTLGYKNLDELRQNLRPVLLRRTRESVMKQLPPRTTEILRIPP